MLCSEECTWSRKGVKDADYYLLGSPQDSDQPPKKSAVSPREQCLLAGLEALDSDCSLHRPLMDSRKALSHTQTWPEINLAHLFSLVRLFCACVLLLIGAYTKNHALPSAHLPCRRKTNGKEGSYTSRGLPIATIGQTRRISSFLNEALCGLVNVKAGRTDM
jgi:hypothetical protein